MADDRQSSLERQQQQARGSDARQPSVRVGCSHVGSQPGRYYRRFSALELQQTFFKPPRPATLERERAMAPASFGFVVKAWQLITHEVGSPGYRRMGKLALPAPAGELGLLRPTPAVDEALRVTLEAARTLAADALLFETPASFAPSAPNRARMARFFERIERSGRSIVWDPRGLWSPADAARVAADLDLVLCRDPLQEEAPPSHTEALYYRLSGLGRRQHLSDDDLLELRDRLEGRTGYCIFDTLEMHKDAGRLLALLA